MTRFGILIAVAALCIGNAGSCVHISEADCASAVTKVSKVRADLELAQVAVASICTTGVASDACRKELQAAAKLHAALDIAMAIATGACPNVTIGPSPPPPDPVPAPAASIL